jgi:hypothetical protein
MLVPLYNITFWRQDRNRFNVVFLMVAAQSISAKSMASPSSNGLSAPTIYERIWLPVLVVYATNPFPCHMHSIATPRPESREATIHSRFPRTPYEPSVMVFTDTCFCASRKVIEDSLKWYINDHLRVCYGIGAYKKSSETTSLSTATRRQSEAATNCRWEKKWDEMSAASMIDRTDTHGTIVSNRHIFSSPPRPSPFQLYKCKLNIVRTCGMTCLSVRQGNGAIISLSSNQVPPKLNKAFLFHIDRQRSHFSFNDGSSDLFRYLQISRSNSCTRNLRLRVPLQY